MKVGIYDLNECSSLDYKVRLEIYKGCGFSSVGLYLDDNYMHNGESYKEIIEYAREIGLSVNQVHVDYKISNLISEDIETYLVYVEEKLKECIELNIPFMVLHASKGNEAPLIDAVSIIKLKELMSAYKDCGTCLCFENVRDNRNLDAILESDINNVGMCYDLGHAYCYDNEFYLLEKYSNKILCTHLHNNYKEDTHNTLFDGEIQCKKIIKRLNKNKRIDNCLEVFPKRGEKLDRDQFIAFVYDNYRDYKKCLRIF